MTLVLNNRGALNQDILPLFLQSKQQISEMKLKTKYLENQIEDLHIQIEEFQKQSVNVKSVCANCINISKSYSGFDTDSLLYQKIFEKNFSRVSEEFKQQDKIPAEGINWDLVMKL